MADFPHMDWYPRDYIADTRHLTPEQRGCYSDLLSYAWLNGAQLPDDDAKLARMCGVTQARFRSKIRPALAEFWAIENDLWIQKRQQKEFMLVEQKVGKLRANASRGGKAKALNQRETVLADASQMLAENPSKRVPITEAYTDSKKENPPLVPPKGKPTRKTRWPDGMVLSDEMRAYAVTQCPTVDADAQFESWRLYCEREDKKYARWDAAWKTWCRNGYNTPRQPVERKPSQEGIVDVTNRVADRLRAARCDRDQPPVERHGQAQRAEGGQGGAAVAVLPDGREVPIHGDPEGGDELDRGSPVVASGGEGFRGRATSSNGSCDAAIGEQERSVGQDPCVVAEGVERALGEIVRGTTSRPHDHRRGGWLEPASPDGATEPGDEYGSR